MAIWAGSWFRRRRLGGSTPGSDPLVSVVTMACLGASFLILTAAMFVLTPNSVSFTAYLQPLVVAGFLSLSAVRKTDARTLDSPAPDSQTPTTCMLARRRYAWLFGLLALLAGVRALGLSTWGLLCALDCNYRSSIGIVQTEISGMAPGQTAVLSSAYLYQAARNQDARWVHCDWMAPAERDQESTDWRALISLRPHKLVLTQFDYFRRFQGLLAKLRARPDLASVGEKNAARVPAPDSIRPLRRVLQHVSWAPVRDHHRLELRR